MLLEEVASQILVNAGRYTNNAQALKAFKEEFTEHFPNRSYDLWNKDIPESLVENIIKNVGKNSSVSVRFLIKDLETISKLV